MTNKEWIAMFDNINFDEKDVKKEVKYFVETILSRKDKEAKSKSAPMGVSQWKEYGKKYGYWKYFKDECKKEKLFIINSVPCETIFEIPEDMNPVTLRGRDGVTAESIAGVRCGYQQKTKEIWDWKKQQRDLIKDKSQAPAKQGAKKKKHNL